MAFSPKKLEQVILFFLERINNRQLGRTKLMKLLYYVDFDHFEKHGHSITNAVYRKLPHGPVPKEAQRVIEDMSRKNLVQPVRAKVADYAQHRLIPLKGQCDLAEFTRDELDTLEKVAQDWRDATAAQIEAASHAEAPWAATPNGEVIDYELASYRKPVGKEPIESALAKSKKFAKYVAALR